MSTSFALVGGNLLTPLRNLNPGIVVVEGDRIVAVGDEHLKIGGSVREIDVDNLFVSPGFIDIHLHGGGGHDVMEGAVEGLKAIAEAHARGGTTSWLGTTLTAPIDQIEKALAAMEKVVDASQNRGARLLGAHLEGPYFSLEQAGAQNPAYLKNPNLSEFGKLADTFSCIKRVSAAPELPGALELGTELRRRGILASIGHSNATYQDVIKGMEAGFTHVTHIYSGMSSVRRINAYRFSGVLETTLLLDDLTTEMIVDGHHLPPSLLRLIIKAKGTDRVCAITDATAPAGLGPGKYQLGGLDVIVEDVVAEGYEAQLKKGDCVAKLADRSAFAGSVATMNKVVRNLVRLANVPPLDAVKMATWTPARIIGMSHERGLLAPGMKADLVAFDKDFNVRMTIVEGNVVYQL